jgi:hypothetical protein
MEAQPLTTDEIKAFANAKIDSLRGEAQDVACQTAWDRVMNTSTIVAAGMAVTLPLGGMAGIMGLAAWGLGAVSVAIGGVMFAWREGQDIYSGDSAAIDRWLPDDDWAALANRAEQVKLAAADAIKKPMGAVDATKAANHLTLENTKCHQMEHSSGSPEAATTAPVPYAPIKLDPDCPHFLLLAGSREGKTNALRNLLDGHARVNYVSTKATDQIPGHWEGYVVGGTAEAMGQQLQWLLTHWGAKLAAHASGTDSEPAWFVFDEAIQLQTYAKRSKVRGLADALAGLQIEIATQGAAIGAYGVLLAQTKNAGPLNIDLDLLQQNFRMVIPLKSKRRLALSVIEKMGGLRMSIAQREDILTNPNRYLQLWLGEDEDIYHDVLPEFEGELKPLIKCPAFFEGSTPSMATEPTETAEPKPLEARVLDYLRGHGEARTAREIRGACTQSTDTPRASVDEVRDILALMISEGQISRWEEGSTERYQATGTA